MSIILENITYRYPRSKTDTLHNISVHFNRGEICCIYGDNGAGKSTLGKVIMGIAQTKGSITYKNQAYKKLSDIGNYIGYMFQNVDHQLFGMTVKEELYFPYELQGLPISQAEQECKHGIEQFNIEHLLDCHPLELSGGEKQRVILVTLLARNTDYFLLDEPTASLDNDAKLFLQNFLMHAKKQNKGIIMITHDKEFANSISDRIIVMENGDISEDYNVQKDCNIQKGTVHYEN